ncbi:copper resistance protein CopZ [Roseobacter denitrificans]|uniref:Nitrous oxide reductase accessory protein NosL n=1 Tax=Roseobacter denitrificans (strain ATCC 33942 / OCh 114) TaxID=375451 RepID=Q16A13_ROSDO|nr:nitrous oxide reductase accessory protein NosL [Roseobacter denitrificans]ABG31180.1 nitrous oxide reductase accessory protein NosL [Roseobacter denitrificans OCh 114]AVL54239.1 copper resistance protein CopZ [Roseobacter denitrificans]SFF97652.1 copper chaperone NosL [Roseobacter denitrificans OCh 114]
MKKLLLLSALLLIACKEELAEAPDPMPLTAENVAHYCMMNISEHPGPKAQIFLSGVPDPIFFAQVRDAFTYLASAEQDGYVAAVYVNDMSTVSWDRPGAENWMLAQNAHYVVGSDKPGGMGAPELVPFSDPARALAFASRYGGAIYEKHEVPEQSFLAPVDLMFGQEENG